jgi:hypothetical protein
VRFASIASKCARALVTNGVPDEHSALTGTVQRDAGGGAWVHMMVFVPAVDIEEADAFLKSHTLGPDPSNGGFYACSCGQRWMSLEQANGHKAQVTT